MHARIGALHRHHLLRRIQGLPADRVVHPPEGRARPLAPGTAPHPPLAGAERILLRDRGNRTAGRCGDRDPDAPHAGHRRGRLPHRAPQDAHLGGAAPLRRARLRRQDRPARHAPPALQQALHAGRHHRLLLRLFGPLDPLHPAVRSGALLQRILHRPAPAHRPRPHPPPRRSGEDVRHLPRLQTVGRDHGGSHRGQDQRTGAGGQHPRAGPHRRGFPREDPRGAGRPHRRGQRLARHAAGSDLGPLVERQNHLGQAAEHPDAGIGAEPRDRLAGRLLRRPREDPAR